MDVDAVPTIFYRRSDSGLREIVTLKASAMQPLQHGSATLTLAGKPYSCDLNSDYEFGEAGCAVQVPEFKNSDSAQLSIHAGAAAAQKEFTACGSTEVEALPGSANTPGHGIHGLPANVV